MKNDYPDNYPATYRNSCKFAQNLKVTAQTIPGETIPGDFSLCIFRMIKKQPQPGKQPQPKTASKNRNARKGLYFAF